MSQPEQGENHISLTTSGSDAIADARSILSSFNLDDKTVSEVSIEIAYANGDDDGHRKNGLGGDQPGRVRPGTAESTVLLAIYGEFADEWFTIAEADNRVECNGTMSSAVSRLERRKSLFDRRPAEQGTNANYEYRLNTAGVQEAERLLEDV